MTQVFDDVLELPQDSRHVAQLVISDTGEKHMLVEGENIIGREPSNGVCLSHPSISGENHALININMEEEGGLAIVSHREGKNKSYYLKNQEWTQLKPKQSYVLKSGTRLRFGHCDVTFELLEQHAAGEEDDTEDEGEGEGAEESTVPQLGTAELNDDSDDGKDDLANADTLAIVAPSEEDSDIGMKGDATQNPMQEATQAPLGHVEDEEDDEGRDEGAETLRPREEEVEVERHAEVDAGKKGDGEEGRTSEGPLQAAGEEQEKEDEGEEEEDLLNTTLVEEEGDEDEEDGDEVGSAVYDIVDEGAGMKDSEGNRASSVSSLGPPEPQQAPASGAGSGGMWADDGDETEDEAEEGGENATHKDEDIIDSPTQPPPAPKGQGKEEGDEERDGDEVEEEINNGQAATVGDAAKPAGEEDDEGSEFDFAVPTRSDVAAARAAKEDSAIEAEDMKVDEKAGKVVVDEHGQMPVSPAERLIDAAGTELVSPPLPPHVETPAAADAAPANGSAVSAPPAAEAGGAQEEQGGEEAGKPESEDAVLSKRSKGNADAATKRKPTRGQTAKQQQEAEEEEEHGQTPVSPAQQLIDAAGKELVSPPLPPHVETPAAADAAAAATSDAVHAPSRAEASGAQEEQGGEEAEKPESHAPAQAKGRKAKAGDVPTRKPTRRQAAKQQQQQQENEAEDTNVGSKGEADEHLPATDADKDELLAAPPVSRAAAQAKDDSKSSQRNARGRGTAAPPFRIGKAAAKESGVSAAEDAPAAEVQTSQTRGGRSRKAAAAVADADKGSQKAVRRGGRRGLEPGGVAAVMGEGGDDEASVSTSESSAAAQAGQKRSKRGGANKPAAVKEVEGKKASDGNAVDDGGVDEAGKGLEVAEQEAEGESVKERGGGRRGLAAKGRERVKHDVSFAEQPSEAAAEGGAEKVTEGAEDSVSLEGIGRGQRRGRRGTTSRTAAVKEGQAPPEGPSVQTEAQAEKPSGRQQAGRARGRGKAKPEAAAHPESETEAKEASAAGAKASRTGGRRAADTAGMAAAPPTTVPTESDADQSTARAQTRRGANGRKAAELGVLADDDKHSAAVEGDAEASVDTKKPATRGRGGKKDEAQGMAEERKTGGGKRAAASAVTKDDAGGNGEGDTTETDESQASRKQGSRGGMKQKTEFAAPATRARRGGGPAAEEAVGGEESIGVKEEDIEGKGRGRARKRGARDDATAAAAERDDAKAIKKAKRGDSASASVPPPLPDEPIMAQDEGSHAEAAEGGKKRGRGATVASVGGPAKRSARGRGVVKEEESTQESHASTSSRRRPQPRSSTARGGLTQDSMSVEGDASESQLSRTASRKSAAASRHHVLFSGFSSSKKGMLEKKMKDINCILEDNVKKATVVITNDKSAEDGMQWFHRTPNVMAAIAYGIPIVDVSWLADSVNHASARNVTDEYLANTKMHADDEGFDLRAALERAAATKLLADKCVCVKGAKKLPNESDRADIVAACGGRWSPEGDVQSGEELLLFTNVESLEDDPKLADQVKAIAENAGVPVYPADALFTSVVRQELLLGDPLDLDGGGGGKKPAGAKRKRGR